jgi:hypothetical protein
MREVEEEMALVWENARDEALWKEDLQNGKFAAAEEVLTAVNKAADKFFVKARPAVDTFYRDVAKQQALVLSTPRESMTEEDEEAQAGQGDKAVA